MNDNTQGSPQPDQEHRADKKQEKPYEPPRVESVLTSDDLEREIHYAGETS